MHLLLAFIAVLLVVLIAVLVARGRATPEVVVIHDKGADTVIREAPYPYRRWPQDLWFDSPPRLRGGGRIHGGDHHFGHAGTVSHAPWHH